MAGEIRNLELQPRFDLHVGGVKVGSYIGDFRYHERTPLWSADGGQSGWIWRDVVEDVKGMATPTYRLKRKHLAAEYGITIREVRAR
jgi:hypothetical protein